MRLWNNNNNKKNKMQQNQDLDQLDDGLAGLDSLFYIYMYSSTRNQRSEWPIVSPAPLDGWRGTPGKNMVGGHIHTK